MVSLIYAVRHWLDLYEVGRDEWRSGAPPTYIRLPIQLDDPGYQRVCRQKGAAVFGAWCGIISVAAQTFPRGVLINTKGQGLDSAALARVTHLPSRLFDQAIPFFLNDVRWLVEVSQAQVADMIERGKGR